MQPKIFAHRGASRYAPENTLPAFALAAEQGADGVELDVHLTRDDQLVVIHDETLERTTDGAGWVKDCTLAQLQTLSAANGMDGFAGTRVPTLRQVLEQLRPTGLPTGSSPLPSTTTASRRSGRWTPRPGPPTSMPTSSAMWKNTPRPGASAGCTRDCGM